MMFGKNENSPEAVSTDSEQSNIQKKRHESDIEKNILVLEDSISNLKGDFATASEIKNIKESLAALSQIKDKLREIEDLELITKLEAIQTQDDVHDLTDGIGTLKTKVDLLSGAIKMISTKITETPKLVSQDTKKGAANIEKMTLSLKSDVDSLRKEVTSLKTAVDKAENLEKHIYDLDKKLAGVQLPKESLNKLSSENASGDYLKYVPVIKENISKLYKVYNRTEKRVNDIENNINEIEALKKNPAASVPSALNEAVKKTVDYELKEVLENINTLTADIRSQIVGEIGKQNTLIDTLKKDYETRIHSLESEIAGVQKKNGNAKSYNYEEFAEFRARMLNEIDQLRKDTKEFEKRISSGELENIVDNKLTPHVSNQDKIAKSLALLNRKVEQKHLEVSKNTHEKINTSVKSIIDRISQIESELNLLKDMRVDLVDDITAILDQSGKEKADANISTRKLEEKYDTKFKELKEMIERVHESGASEGIDAKEITALKKSIAAIQNEKGPFRQEMEQLVRMNQAKINVLRSDNKDLKKKQDQAASTETAVADEIQKKYGSKFKELAKKIEAIQHESGASEGIDAKEITALKKSIVAIQNEKDTFRQEMEHFVKMNQAKINAFQSENNDLKKKFGETASAEVAVADEIQKKYGSKFRELAKKIEAIQHESSASKDAEMQDTRALAKGIRSIQYENEILKQELEKIKSLYFEILQQKEEIPVIID